MRIRSRPAPMPSGRTPSTSTSKRSGVEPRTTVHPSPFMPAVTDASGTAAGQGFVGPSADTSGTAFAGPGREVASRASRAPAPVASVLPVLNQPTWAMGDASYPVDVTKRATAARRVDTGNLSGKRSRPGTQLETLSSRMGNGSEESFPCPFPGADPAFPVSRKCPFGTAEETPLRGVPAPYGGEGSLSRGPRLDERRWGSLGRVLGRTPRRAGRPGAAPGGPER